MIYSMTGYAAVQVDLGSASLDLELKSVNSRYLDIQFRIGEELRFLELPLRELISARIARGKVECRGGLSASHARGRNQTPDLGALEQLAKLQAVVRAVLPEAPALTVAEALRWPGVLAEESLSQETLQAQCLALAGRALEDFQATREREGGEDGRHDRRADDAHGATAGSGTAALAAGPGRLPGTPGDAIA